MKKILILTFLVSLIFLVNNCKASNCEKLKKQSCKDKDSELCKKLTSGTAKMTEEQCENELDSLDSDSSFNEMDKEFKEDPEDDSE